MLSNRDGSERCTAKTNREAEPRSITEKEACMDKLLEVLRAFDALRDHVDVGQGDRVETRVVPSQPPTFAPSALDGVKPAIKRALEKQGVEALYEHQADAIKCAKSGANVVLQSPTASGKTLAFAIPMFDQLLTYPKSHALLLHPMNALSNDQKRQIDELAGELNDQRKIHCWPYDGDTDVDYRSVLRNDPPAILLTNPEMLHLSFLYHADKHDAFLRGLRFIVIDEIHEYRGYFGSNVALLLRRFLEKLERIGNKPQLFLATATCANPKEHAERLTGRQCELVSASSKMRPERHFAFINPCSIPDYKFYDTYKVRIARAGLACASLGLSTIVFCPSRKFAEDVCVTARKDAATYDVDPGKVVPYKSGILAEKRRNIEEGLRSGNYQVVFCTNALELGIDIGRLDVCVLAGFPDNAMSAWQRIGRTGRSWQKTAYVLFYAMNDAFDQFYADNIDAFLEKPLDEIVLSTENEELINRHVPYLLHETEWNLPESSRSRLGEKFYQCARSVITHQKPSRQVPNYKRLDIRGGSGQILKLVHGGKEIGTMSDVQRFREAYIGAVYSHCGKPYRVVGYTQDEIELEETEHNHRTQPIFWTQVVPDDTLKGLRYGGHVSVYYGKITVFENLAGYKLIDSRNDEVLEDVPKTDTRRTNPRAFWISVEDTIAVELDGIGRGVKALEHLLRIGASLMIPCDRHDISTTTAGTTVYVYENVAGGIGIAEKAFEVWQEILKEGTAVAKKCPCKDGCPRCICPPRRRDSEKLSKQAGLQLADYLLKLAGGSPTERLDPITYGWRAL